jgi:MPBQ/MSBQ methyltransferase
VRAIQHKREAWWFYRFLSLGYDRWVNPLFWTAPMRAQALEHARLDRPDLETLDVGAGTGFTTEGIVERIEPARVTMLDQSPHQLARAQRKPALRRCRKVLGDAEELPFDDDAFDRYVSAGSVEYWPEPQRAVAEAYRVLRSGGTALLIGPLRPRGRAARALAGTWMLFPEAEEYREWFARAGFEQLDAFTLGAPWHGDTTASSRAASSPRHGGDGGYALVMRGVKPGVGPSPLALEPKREDLSAPLGVVGSVRFVGRFLLGSLAGAAFVPVGVVLGVRARLARRAR